MALYAIGVVPLINAIHDCDSYTIGLMMQLLLAL